MRCEKKQFPEAHYLTMQKTNSATDGRHHRPFSTVMNQAFLERKLLKGRSLQDEVYQRSVKFPGHTFLVPASAAGDVLPSLVIFEGSCPKLDMSAPSDLSYKSSKKGYVNTDIFKLWFTEVFLPNIPKQFLTTILPMYPLMLLILQ